MSAKHEFYMAFMARKGLFIFFFFVGVLKTFEQQHCSIFIYEYFHLRVIFYLEVKLFKDVNIPKILMVKLILECIFKWKN